MKTSTANWVGFQTLAWREVRRMFLLSAQTLFPPLISSLLYIAIFGRLLGERIDSILPGVSYIDFVIPGILMMQVTSGSFAHTSFAINGGKFMNAIQELLVAPMSYIEIVAGFLAGGVARGVLLGLGVYAVGIFFTSATIAHFWSFLFFLVATSLLFSALGAIVGLWAKNFEQLNLPTTFILLPLNFFAGVFHSVRMLPEWLQVATYINPIFYMVNGIRGSMIGQSDISPLLAGAVVSSLAAFAFVWCVVLFRRGWRLRN